MSVGYWVAMINRSRQPLIILDLFRKHILSLNAHSMGEKNIVSSNNKNINNKFGLARRAGFVSSFIENGGILALLTIKESIDNQVSDYNCKYTFGNQRLNLLKTLEIIITTKDVAITKETLSTPPPIPIGTQFSNNPSLASFTSNVAGRATIVDRRSVHFVIFLGYGY